LGFFRDLREVFGTIRHVKASKDKYCPRCGSKGVRISGSFGFWLSPKRYVCDKCGYLGPVFMELDKEEDSVKRDCLGESS
jgi:transposase-like protein